MIEPRLIHSSEPTAYDEVLSSPAKPLAVRDDLLRPHEIVAAAMSYCPPMFEPTTCAGIIAGGFVRDTVAGRAPKDLDLYVPDDAVVARLADRLREAGWRATGSHIGMTTWQGPLSRVVQVIRTEHSHPSALISRFDLTICCAAVDLRDQTGWSASEFLTDLKERRLVLHSPAFPVDTLRRISRFVSEGFTISGQQIQVLHARILEELHANGVYAFRPEELIARPAQRKDRAA